MPTPRKYDSNAERQRAYRVRRKAREQAERAALELSDRLAELAIQVSVSTEPATPEEIELETQLTVNPGLLDPPKTRRPGLISEEEFRALLTGRELVVSLNLD